MSPRNDPDDPRRRRRFAGRVISVVDELAGSTLTDDVLAGATALAVEDATYFDENGGTLQITDEFASEVIAYTDVDYDSDIVTVAGLVNSYEAEADVLIYPLVPMRFAEVAPTGAGENTIRAVVPSEVALVLPLGTREDDEQERVTIEFDPYVLAYVVIHAWTTTTDQDPLQTQTGRKVLHYTLEDPCTLPYCGQALTGLAIELEDVRGEFAGAPVGAVSVDVKLGGELLHTLSFDAGQASSGTDPLGIFSASTDDLEFCFPADLQGATLPFNGYLTANFG